MGMIMIKYKWGKCPGGEKSNIRRRSSHSDDFEETAS